MADEREAFSKLDEQPGGLAGEASGGNYLSNEVFYRASLAQSSLHSSLASGHLHIPDPDNQPQTLGSDLIRGVTRAPSAFAEDNFLLGSAAVGFCAGTAALECAVVSDFRNQ